MSSFNTIDLENQINKDLGVTPKEIVSDGKIHRFDIDKKSDQAGWISIREWDFNGKTYAMANYGSWKEGFNRKWKSWSKQDELSTPGLTASVTNASKETEKENDQFCVIKKEEILSHFSNFSPLDSSNSYLEKKKIKTTENLLQDNSLNLIVPIYSDINKTLEGYQRILKTQKVFPTGQKVQSNFFFFGDIKNSEYVYICEGMATGATIYELTGVPVVVAFQANNLHYVTKKIQHSLKGVKIVIASDNDSKKTGAGMYWAKRAQNQSTNVAIVCPYFSKNSTLTDFNDLFCAQGDTEALNQLKFDESLFVDVEFLGFSNGQYHFYSTKTKEIRSFSLEKMKSGHLVELAVDAYWSQRFTPVYDKESGLPTNYCNWRESSLQIVKKQNDLGSFQGDKIRGVGSWIDNGHHVLNLGDKLLVNEELTGFGKNSNLSKFYKPSNIFNIDYIEKETKNFSALIKAFDLIDFKSDRDKIIALGFVAYAQVFTTRRWRPHVWVRADKGTGKSSLLEFVNEIIPNSQMFQDTTSAGLRQIVGVDSRVCLIDEAEGESHRTKQLIELARQASSGSKTTIGRGTPSGQALNFNPQMCFFFASIRAADLTPADESRILQISMQKPKKQNREKINKMRRYMADASFLGHDLFKFMNKNVKKLKALIESIHDMLLDTGEFDSRYADQHAPIIAAFSLLNPLMDVTDVIAAVCKQDVNQNEDKDTDQNDFYTSFLNILIREGQEEKTLHEIMAEVYSCKNEARVNYLLVFLNRYGLEYKKNKKLFFISKNQNMTNLMAKQTNYKNYYAQMKDNKFFQAKRSSNGVKRGFEFDI